MDWTTIGFMVLTTLGWGTAMMYDKKVRIKDYELYLKKLEILSLKRTIQRLKDQKYKETIYSIRPTEIPKGTIDAVKLAMKVSHPDNGGNNEDFIKYNEIYQKLMKGNYKI